MFGSRLQMMEEREVLGRLEMVRVPLLMVLLLLMEPL